MSQFTFGTQNVCCLYFQCNCGTGQAKEAAIIGLLRTGQVTFGIPPNTFWFAAKMLK